MNLSSKFRRLFLHGRPLNRYWRERIGIILPEWVEEVFRIGEGEGETLLKEAGESLGVPLQI